MTAYKIEILGIIAYYQMFYKRLGKKLFEFTDSGYPTFLALGYCSGKDKVNSVCKLFNWRLRLLHEIGHECWFSHTKERGHVMHPLGIFRGTKGGSDIIKEYINKYGIDNIPYSFESAIAGEDELIETYRKILEGEAEICTI